MKETTEMEKNVNYGVEDDYYNEHDDRVQDTNDYYQQISLHYLFTN